MIKVTEGEQHSVNFFYFCEKRKDQRNSYEFLVDQSLFIAGGGGGEGREIILGEIIRILQSLTRGSGSFIVTHQNSTTPRPNSLYGPWSRLYVSTLLFDQDFSAFIKTFLKVFLGFLCVFVVHAIQ